MRRGGAGYNEPVKVFARFLWPSIFALAAAPALVAQEPAEAIVIEEGSVASRQVVAVGRDLVIAGEAGEDVAVIGASVDVTGTVEGDLIVLGGDAHLASDALVGGDAYVLGGEIEATTGAEIRGRSVAYPSAPSTWLVLLEGPAIGLPVFSPVVLAAKLALLAGWLVAALLLLSTSRRQLMVTANRVRAEPFRCFFAGVVGVAAMVLTIAFFSAFAAAVVGVPLLVLAGLFALILKIWGTVAVFVAAGGLLLEWIGRGRELPLTVAIVGIVGLGILKLVPYVGIWAWTIVTFIGVGAALSTKLGRDEPWFDTVAEAS